MTIDLSDWIPAKEAAKRMGRGVDALDQLRAAKKLIAHPVRTVNNRVHRYLYDPESIEAFLLSEATRDRAARGWAS